MSIENNLGIETRIGQINPFEPSLPFDSTGSLNGVVGSTSRLGRYREAASKVSLENVKGTMKAIGILAFAGFLAYNALGVNDDSAYAIERPTQPTTDPLEKEGFATVGLASNTFEIGSGSNKPFKVVINADGIPQNQFLRVQIFSKEGEFDCEGGGSVHLLGTQATETQGGNGENIVECQGGDEGEQGTIQFSGDPGEAPAVMTINEFTLIEEDEEYPIPTVTPVVEPPAFVSADQFIAFPIMLKDATAGESPQAITAGKDRRMSPVPTVNPVKAYPIK